MTSNYTILGIFVVFLVIILSVSTYIAYGTQDTVTVTVTGKERIVESTGESTSSKYLVFTTDETFENTDTIFHGKFNSSDIQGKLHVDSTYTFEVVGFRIPFLSSYRNIIGIQE